MAGYPSRSARRRPISKWKPRGSGSRATAAYICRTLSRRSAASSSASVIRCRMSERRADREEVPRGLEAGCDTRKDESSALPKKEARPPFVVLNRREERVSGQTAPRRHSEPRGRIVDAHLEHLTALEPAHLTLHPRFECAARFTVAFEQGIGVRLRLLYWSMAAAIERFCRSGRRPRQWRRKLVARR